MSQDQIKYANKLHDANILVTGGTSGIGYAVAEAALEYGAHVTVSSSNSDRVHEAVARLQKAYPSKKDSVKGYSCDLGDKDTLEKNAVGLLEKVVQDTGKKIDHIVHTAGSAYNPKPLSEMAVADLLGPGGESDFGLLDHET